MDTKALKDKILQLAIQGKLVDQDPNDEPASVLLEKIEKEKEKLIKEKKIKKQKPLPEIIEEEKPFEIPEGWEWVRLGDLGIFKKGPFGSTITKSMFVPKADDTIKVYEQKNAIQKDWTLGDYYITKEYFESKLKGFEVFEGDVIVSCAGTIGETYIMPHGIGKGIINQALMKMKIYDSINVNYFLLYFDFIIKDTANESSKGSAIKNIPPLNILKNILIPLPPLSEQKRIVEKVDELFALIDELEGDREEFLEFINLTRNKVLQLAIQGKLVDQDPNDEPASVLLEKIEKEKEKLIKEKKIKKQKPLPEIAEEEKPFEIPEGWEWVRLGEISKTISKGTTPKGGTSVYKEKGVNFLRVENMTKDYRIDLSRIKLIDRKVHENELKRSIGEKNDLLISIAGTLGRVAILKEEHLPCNMNQAICFVRVFYQNINIDYLKYIISSFDMQKSMIDKTKTTAQPNLTLEIISNLILPLPPLSEQKRIVEKVDEIMNLCDELEKEINAHFE